MTTQAPTHIERLILHELSAFQRATFEFVDGINVFIGANATGKSHAMKSVYCAVKTMERPEDPVPLDSRLLAKLARVFRPDRYEVSRLVRRRHGANRADVKVSGHSGTIDFSIVPKARVKLRVNENTWRSPATSIFLPTREALSIYPGFVATYENRELAFDETYYDICVALGAGRLRGSRMKEAALLLDPIEAVLGGKVVTENNEFYLRGKDGLMEAPLIAEGLRKLAMVAQLIANGSLMTNGFLFWDEPEANLNPKLITVVANMLLELARQNVQVFIATHDYLLAHRLSLIAEYAQPTPAVDIRFFSLFRPTQEAPVEVAAGRTLADLPQNPIFDEFAKEYDFERELFASAHQGGRK